MKPFGKITIDSAPSLEWNLAYTGKYLDLVADLQNNLHRWYDAYIAKWISADPIGFEAGDANLYRYVGNGPLWQVDPEGFCSNTRRVKNYAFNVHYTFKPYEDEWHSAMNRCGQTFDWYYKEIWKVSWRFTYQCVYENGEVKLENFDKNKEFAIMEGIKKHGFHTPGYNKITHSEYSYDKTADPDRDDPRWTDIDQPPLYNLIDSGDNYNSFELKVGLKGQKIDKSTVSWNITRTVSTPTPVYGVSYSEEYPAPKRPSPPPYGNLLKAYYMRKIKVECQCVNFSDYTRIRSVRHWYDGHVREFDGQEKDLREFTENDIWS